MRIFLTLLRRELGAIFLSITGYVIIASVALLNSLSFVVLMTNLGNDPSPMPVTEMFYRTYFFWLVVLLATPIITMRLFALEKASGTFETLMTTPVGDLQVVAAKFAAANIFYVVAWLPMIACLFVVRYFTNQPGRAGCRHRRRHVSRNFSGRLPVFVAGLFCLGHFTQPDGGGDDQFRAGGDLVFTGLSREGAARDRAMAVAGAVVFRAVRADA